MLRAIWPRPATSTRTSGRPGGTCTGESREPAHPLSAPPRGAVRALERAARRRGQRDQMGDALHLPRPLVVSAGRDRAVLVRGPGWYRRLFGPLLQPGRLAGHLPRALRPAAGRAD